MGSPRPGLFCKVGGWLHSRVAGPPTCGNLDTRPSHPVGRRIECQGANSELHFPAQPELGNRLGGRGEVAMLQRREAAASPLQGRLLDKELGKRSRGEEDLAQMHPGHFCLSWDYCSPPGIDLEAAAGPECS